MMVLNLQNIEFPTLKDVMKFECLNEISINVRHRGTENVKRSPDMTR